MAKIDMQIKQNKVEIVVNNVHSQIKGLQSISVIRALDDNLSYYVSGYQFTAAFKTGWWDKKQQRWKKWNGKSHLLNKDHKFLTGLLERVVSVLKNHNVPHSVIDQRKEVTYKKKIKTKNIEEREYQKRVLQSCLKHKGGIVQSATGSGKSVMITELIANTNVKTIVAVIGIDLLHQTKDVFEKMLGTKVGIIGDGQVDIHKINVCTVWTLAKALGGKYIPFDDEDRSTKETFNNANKEKIVKVVRSSEMILFDECQMLSAKTLQLINAEGKSARYKFGYSGTPYREDNSDLLLEAVCGKIIIEVTASELIHLGFLVPPKIQFISIPNYEGSSTKYPSIYKEYITENEVRNEKIAKISAKLVEAGRKTLVLVKNIKHGKTLVSEFKKLNMNVYFVSGIVDSDTRNKIRQNFIDGKTDLIVASVIFDQGIDIPNLSALVLAGGGKSKGRTIQRIGRVIRPCKGKKDAIVIDFLDNCKYLTDHSIARLNAYREESGFEIKLPKKLEKSNKKSNKKWEIKNEDW